MQALKRQRTQTQKRRTIQLGAVYNKQNTPALYQSYNRQTEQKIWLKPKLPVIEKSTCFSAMGGVGVPGEPEGTRIVQTQMDFGYRMSDSHEYIPGQNKELVARQMALMNKQNGLMNEIARQTAKPMTRPQLFSQVKAKRGPNPPMQQTANAETWFAKALPGTADDKVYQRSSIPHSA